MNTNNLPSTITLSPKLLSLKHCASTDKSRYNLAGVYCDTKKQIACATDGHILAVKAITADEGASGIWDINLKTSKMNDHIPFTCRKVGDTALYSDEIGRGTVNKIDGEFPDFKQVIPKNSSNRVLLGLDANLLLKLAKALNDGEAKNTSGFLNLSIPLPAHNESIVTDSIVVSGKNGAGVIMPMRVEDYNDPVDRIKNITSKL